MGKYSNINAYERTHLAIQIKDKALGLIQNYKMQHEGIVEIKHNVARRFFATARYKATDIIELESVELKDDDGNILDSDLLFYSIDNQTWKLNEAMRCYKVEKVEVIEEDNLFERFSSLFNPNTIAV